MLIHALSIIVLVLISAIFGPFMALAYPSYSILFKIILILGLAAAVGIIIFGVKKKKYLIILIGVLIWTMIGLFYGLSTAS
jgi:hypothetical protein